MSAPETDDETDLPEHGQVTGSWNVLRGNVRRGRLREDRSWESQPPPTWRFVYVFLEKQGLPTVMVFLLAAALWFYNGQVRNDAKEAAAAFSHIAEQQTAAIHELVEGVKESTREISGLKDYLRERERRR